MTEAEEEGKKILNAAILAAGEAERQISLLGKHFMTETAKLQIQSALKILRRCRDAVDGRIQHDTDLPGLPKGGER